MKNSKKIVGLLMAFILMYAISFQVYAAPEILDSERMTPISGPAPVNENNEEYINLFDDDITTKWYHKESIPDAIIWEVDEAVAAFQYMFTSANDSVANPGRMPISWILSGSASSADGPWTVIDEQPDNPLPDADYEEFLFDIATPQNYKYYKLEFTELGTNSRLQLSELSLYIDKLPEAPVVKEEPAVAEEAPPAVVEPEAVPEAEVVPETVASQVTAPVTTTAPQTNDAFWLLIGMIMVSIVSVVTVKKVKR